jgi:hypothetical protein
MHPVDFMAVEKDPFSQRGLAGIDVGADPNVPERRYIGSHDPSIIADLNSGDTNHNYGSAFI